MATSTPGDQLIKILQVQNVFLGSFTGKLGVTLERVEGHLVVLNFVMLDQMGKVILRSGSVLLQEGYTAALDIMHEGKRVDLEWLQELSMETEGGRRIAEAFAERGKVNGDTGVESDRS